MAARFVFKFIWLTSRVCGINRLALKLRVVNHPDGYPIWITDTIYKRMADDAKTSSDGCNMWEERLWAARNNRVIHRSNRRNLGFPDELFADEDRQRTFALRRARAFPPKAAPPAQRIGVNPINGADRCADMG
jgi:hypothetical protein